MLAAAFRKTTLEGSLPAGSVVTAIGWMVAAVISAAAASLSVRHATPIDAALPFIVVVVTFVAWGGRSWTQVAVPFLVIVELTTPDEPLRLMLFGAALSVVFVAALVRAELRIVEACTIAVAAILLLRWIPFGNVILTRELLLVAIGIAIVTALRGTPFAVAVAVLAVFVTPAVPLRTFVLAGGVLLAALLTRVYAARRVNLPIPAAAVVALTMLPFAWSGVVARAPRYFFARPAAAPRTAIQVALPPGQSLVLDVPADARSLIVSGANVAHLAAGTTLGRIMPGNVPIRIGDAADWGYMRREQFYASYNALPRHPAGSLRGYGYAAWADGAGRVALPPGAKTIEITADPTIPSDASLQVEGFELTQ